MPPFITSEKVAEMIGLPDAQAFLRIRPRLERDHLFPLPMPTYRRTMRWRTDEVAAWVARNGRPCPPDVLARLPANPMAAPLAAAIATGKVALIERARSA